MSKKHRHQKKKKCPSRVRLLINIQCVIGTSCAPEVAFIEISPKAAAILLKTAEEAKKFNQLLQKIGATELEYTNILQGPEIPKFQFPKDIEISQSIQIVDAQTVIKLHDESNLHCHNISITNEGITLAAYEDNADIMHETDPIPLNLLASIAAGKIPCL